jgi:hypothetical protein
MKDTTIDKLQRRFDVSDLDDKDWIEERLRIIEDPLLRAYADAKDEDGRAIENLSLDGLSEKERSAVWELYAATAPLVYDAVETAAAKYESKYEGGEDVSERMQGSRVIWFVYALCRYFHQDNRYKRSVWHSTFCAAKEWAYRHVSENTSGGEKVTRLIQNHLEECSGTTPAAIAKELRDQYATAAAVTLETVIDRVRAVMSQRPVERLDDTRPDGEFLLKEVTPDPRGAPIEVEKIGRELASLIGEEEMWERMITPPHQNAWTIEEVKLIGTMPDAELAIELGREYRRVEKLRRALGWSVRGATPVEAGELRRRYEHEDVTQAELAEEMGQSTAIVSKVLCYQHPYDYRTPDLNEIIRDAFDDLDESYTLRISQ